MVRLLVLEGVGPGSILDDTCVPKIDRHFVCYSFVPLGNIFLTLCVLFSLFPSGVSDVVICYRKLSVYLINKKIIPVFLLCVSAFGAVTLVYRLIFPEAVTNKNPAVTGVSSLRVRYGVVS